MPTRNYKRRLPWPIELAARRAELAAEQQRLEHLIRVLQTEGLAEYNYGLLDLLLPKIEQRAVQIQTIARQIRQNLAPRRVGREPAWAVALLEINALADKILRGCDHIKTECKSNRFITVEHLLGLILKAAQDINSQLQSSPQEQDDIPAVFREYERDDRSQN